MKSRLHPLSALIKNHQIIEWAAYTCDIKNCKDKQEISCTLQQRPKFTNQNWKCWQCNIGYSLHFFVMWLWTCWASFFSSNTDSLFTSLMRWAVGLKWQPLPRKDCLWAHFFYSAWVDVNLKMIRWEIDTKETGTQCGRTTSVFSSIWCASGTASQTAVHDSGQTTFTDFFLAIGKTKQGTVWPSPASAKKKILYQIS